MSDTIYKKIRMSLLALLLFLIIGITLLYKEKDGSLQVNELIRPMPGEPSKVLWLKCVGEYGEEIMPITISPGEYSKEDIEKLYGQFVSQVRELIRGENIDLRNVKTNLKLCEEYEGYPFTFIWNTSDGECLTKKGEVIRKETDCEVNLTVTAKVNGQERELTFPVCILSIYDKSEYYSRLSKYLEQIDEAKDNTFILPKAFEGENLIWESVSGKTGWIFIIGAVPFAGLIFVMSRIDEQKKSELEKQNSKADYPAIVLKLALYFGAGLSIRAAFIKVATEYESKQSKTGEKNRTYEIMLLASREFDAGRAEWKVYEQFGKTVGTGDYIRLGTILSQNLTKGSELLTDRLNEEVENAYAMRVREVKKLGEEAGTRMLVPMVLLLVVVMSIIMIPAMSVAAF